MTQSNFNPHLSLNTPTSPDSTGDVGMLDYVRAFSTFFVPLRRFKKGDYFYENKALFAESRRIIIEEVIEHRRSSTFPYQEILFFKAESGGRIIAVDGDVQIVECIGPFNQIWTLDDLRGPSGTNLKALLLGGGDGGVLSVLSKFFTFMDVVDRDEEVHKLSAPLLPSHVREALSERRIELHFRGALDFLRGKSRDQKYHAIVCDTSNPAAKDALFTIEFLKLVKEFLDPVVGILYTQWQLADLATKVADDMSTVFDSVGRFVMKMPSGLDIGFAVAAITEGMNFGNCAVNFPATPFGCFIAENPSLCFVRRSVPSATHTGLQHNVTTPPHTFRGRLPSEIHPSDRGVELRTDTVLNTPVIKATRTLPRGAFACGPESERATAFGKRAAQDTSHNAPDIESSVYGITRAFPTHQHNIQLKPAPLYAPDRCPRKIFPIDRGVELKTDAVLNTAVIRLGHPFPRGAFACGSDSEHASEYAAEVWERSVKDTSHTAPDIESAVPASIHVQGDMHVHVTAPRDDKQLDKVFSKNCVGVCLATIISSCVIIAILMALGHVQKS